MGLGGDGWITKETFGNNGYIRYLEYGDGFSRRIHVSPLIECTLQTRVVSWASVTAPQS